MNARKWAFILAACLGLCGYMQGVSVAVAQPVRKDTLTQQEVPTQVDRVPAHPDFSVTSRLSGGLPGWANAANDAGTTLGIVPPETLIHMNFVLTRAPQLEAAFNQLLNDQQNPASPRFHHWLTPQQVGVYGPTQHDLDALSSWLSAQGITVEGIAPSRISLEASAPASVVSRALAISFRYFTLPGDTRFAGTPKLLLSATSEPALPSALIPLVMGVSGLSEIPFHSMVRSVTSPRR
jgi:subtilase family serine protease